jgi:uncharacterized membrane protein
MIAHAVTSERLQRQVERLLDEADRAFTASDWAGLRTSANGVLTLDSENGTARAYLVAATNGLQELTPVLAPPPSDHPNARLEDFCDGVFSVALTLLVVTIALPSTVVISSTAGFWQALVDLVPSLLAFLLSFVVVFITWVNHHTTLRLVNKASSPFIYANGFFLVTVVFLPFPTSLLGNYLLTDYAAPAVALYSGVCALQSIGWFLLTRAALSPEGPLTRDEKALIAMRERHKYSYFGLALYTVLAALALLIPHPVAIAIGAVWFVWLAVGIKDQVD